jgi:predicted nucleic acid-binding protein
MKGFYLDTNIWLDYFENRSSGLIPLGEFAFNFLKKSTESNSELFYSDLVLKELYNTCGKKEIDLKMGFFGKTIKFTSFCKEDYLFAKRISSSYKIHFADAIHVAIAPRNNLIIITRDKHFDCIDFVEVKKPEEVLF